MKGDASKRADGQHIVVFFALTKTLMRRYFPAIPPSHGGGVYNVRIEHIFAVEARRGNIFEISFMRA